LITIPITMFCYICGITLRFFGKKSSTEEESGGKPPPRPVGQVAEDEKAVRATHSETNAHDEDGTDRVNHSLVDTNYERRNAPTSSKPQQYLHSGSEWWEVAYDKLKQENSYMA
jgi:hypothetical protein